MEGVSSQGHSMGQLILSGAVPLLLVLWVEGGVTGPPWEAGQKMVVSRPGRGLAGPWAVPLAFRLTPGPRGTYFLCSRTK